MSSAVAPAAYALRFISGKYQGGEFPVPASGEIVIGRSSELDMVLVEDMVSRRHAKITVLSGVMTIRDLGSTNGTFVNGEKIEETTIKEGDRILVGTSIIKVIATESPGSTSVAQEKMRRAGDAIVGRTAHVKTMTGSIAEIPLPDLLQLFSASKKSGVLVVESDVHVGRVYIDSGNVVFAVVNDAYDQHPLKMFVQVMTWEDGTFDMEPPEERAFENRLEMSTEGLLMESMRLIDEYRRVGEAMPPLVSKLWIPRPLKPALRELNPSQLELLQEAHNGRDLYDLVLGEGASESKSLLLKELVENGYLGVRDGS